MGFQLVYAIALKVECCQKGCSGEIRIGFLGMPCWCNGKPSAILFPLRRVVLIILIIQYDDSMLWLQNTTLSLLNVNRFFLYIDHMHFSHQRAFRFHASTVSYHYTSSYSCTLTKTCKNMHFRHIQKIVQSLHRRVSICVHPFTISLDPPGITFLAHPFILAKDVTSHEILVKIIM